jgi:hypothetical protein
VEELGLEGDEAEDLIKGLGSDSKPESKPEPASSVEATSVAAKEPAQTKDDAEKSKLNAQPEPVATAVDDKATPETKAEAATEKAES